MLIRAPQFSPFRGALVFLWKLSDASAILKVLKKIVNSPPADYLPTASSM
jgi:hypothetical protein